MAQALLAQCLPRVRVFSAGLGALVGYPADPTAIKLMDEEGLDIRGHRAIQVHRDLCTRAHLVFVMDDKQQMRLELLYPQIRGRVFRIGRFSNQNVPDPYRHPEADFRLSLAILKTSISGWLPSIEKIL
jgi:protein-tyrosine phosphatase